MNRDNDCESDSPVTYGLPQAPTYGKGIKITLDNNRCLDDYVGDTVSCVD